MPTAAPGSAVRMMNGSSHDWKFTTIRPYTTSAATRSLEAQPGEGVAHALHLTAHARWCAGRQLFCCSSHDGAEAAATDAEVGVLDVGAHVVRRLHVHVADEDRGDAVIDGRQIGDHLRAARRAHDERADRVRRSRPGTRAPAPRWEKP